MEKAEAAMRACLAAADRGDPGEADRERARATGSLMTPGEIAERMGGEAVELAVITYAVQPTGLERCAPPVDLFVRCLPAAVESVHRSVGKLLESRHWTSQARVSRTKVPRADVEGFLREGDS